MNKLFLSSFNKAINAYLHLDPESKSRLKKLKGKIIAFEFLPFHFIFQCTFTENSIHLSTDTLSAPEATLRGTPIQMLGIALTSDQRQHFFAEDLIIEGNAELAQQVNALFDELHIDWEEYAAHWLGDIPAHHIGRYFRHICCWLNNTKNTLTLNVNEYLHEEAEWFPSREALQDLFTDIDTLHLDVDRIEAKIKHIEESQ
ncbi:MAG TPA: SCP2 sterol-binding domain-containing protein [Gammaproteobacteria bacterium]|nr:SCP2 sterol-binding domain-containing protein [Gammaproteobacteria bacterium]